MSRRGFTIAEILLALALITVVILTLLGLSIQSLVVGQKSQDLVGGQLVAEQVTERLVYGAESNPAAALWGHNLATHYAQETVTLGPTVFNVTTYVNDVAPTDFAINRRLKRLESVVIWQEAQQGKKNAGRLEIRTTRLLHEP